MRLNVNVCGQNRPYNMFRYYWNYEDISPSPFFLLEIKSISVFFHCLLSASPNLHDIIFNLQLKSKFSYLLGSRSSVHFPWIGSNNIVSVHVLIAFVLLLKHTRKYSVSRRPGYAFAPFGCPSHPTCCDSHGGQFGPLHWLSL